MYLELTDEQAFLVEAAEGALSRQPTVAAARAALDGEPYPDLWPLACEAGWPGLLSDEDVDGAGLGAYEALLVLEACGRTLADARLLGHLSAVALLEAADDPDRALRRALAAGERRAALVGGALSVGDAGLRARVGDESLLLEGEAGHVLDAPGADVLIVVAAGPDAWAVGVVESEAPGLSVTPTPAYDATRVVGAVAFDEVSARRIALPSERAADGCHLQWALLAAESVGSADGCLAMARDYAVDRHAFGRAIGSYQAIKHKLVEMMRRVENARSLLAPAGRAWEHDRDAFGLAAGAARVAAADALDFAAPENIFIHGGIGATWEHDAQLYYRRAELSRRLAGGAPAAADAVAEALFAEVDAA